MSRVYVTIAFALLIVGGLWRYDVMIDQRNKLLSKVDELDRETIKLNKELDMSRLAYLQRDQDDRETRGELDEALGEIEHLRDAVDAGNTRLRVQAACPYRDMPETTATTGLADGPSIELSPDAEQDYYTLLREIEEDKAKILGLQRYVKTLCQ